MEKLQKKSENIDFFKEIKVVVFDFDDTLVDEQYFIKTRWEKVLGNYAFLSKKLKETFFDIYRQKGPQYPFHLDDALEKLHIDSKYKREILASLKKETGDELLLGGAMEIITALKEKGLSVGIITDGQRARQEKRIKKAGIYDQMDFIYYGVGAKEKKPDKKVMKEIFEKYHITSPREFLYIGNDFLLDIEGFLAIGAKGCLVGKEEDPPAHPNLIIVKSVKELWKKEF